MSPLECRTSSRGIPRCLTKRVRHWTGPGSCCRRISPAQSASPHSGRSRLMKAVRFDDYGGIDVLEVRDVPRPQPGPDQVLVAVRAAGINIGEAKIREGLVREIFPATFPSGEGSDLAGVVEAVGEGGQGVGVGGGVMGY